MYQPTPSEKITKPPKGLLRQGEGDFRQIICLEYRLWGGEADFSLSSCYT